jgi:hypothetical protein
VLWGGTGLSRFPPEARFGRESAQITTVEGPVGRGWGPENEHHPPHAQNVGGPTGVGAFQNAAARASMSAK